MRSQVCTVFMLLAASLALTGCFLQPDTSVRFSVAKGKQYCEVFAIPTPWTIPPEFPQFSANIEYRWPADSRAEIMISPPPMEERDHLNNLTGRMSHLYRYRFAFSLPVRLKAAREEEWATGSEVRLWPGVGENTNGMLDGRGHAVPRGHREKWSLRLAPSLPRSGDIWADYVPAIMSPRGSYLVLQSWNGSRNSQGSTSNFADLFLDIYRWPSKTLVAKIVGNSGAWLPNAVLDETHWLTNNDLIMQFDDAKNFVFCHMPE